MNDTIVKTIPLSQENEMFLYTEILPLLTETNLRLNFNRKCGIGRSQVFGFGKKRKRDKYIPNGSMYGEFCNNYKYPELYKVLKEFGEKICPIHFNAIQLNHNFSCLPHRDSNNIGDSVTMSFGDYKNGLLYIEGIPYNTNMRPIQFNASQNEHYVSPIIGERYSLVYFVSHNRI